MDNSFQKSEPIPLQLALLVPVMMAAILTIDLLLPLGVAGGVPYVAVVLLGWWLPKRNQIIILAAISTALVLLGYFYSPEGGIPWMVASNRFLALFAIWVSATLLVMAKEGEEKTKRINEELEQRVEERTSELQESEGRFKDFAEAATDRFWEMDKTLRFSSIFDHPESTIFPPPKEIISRTRWEAAGVNPDENEEWGQHRDDLLARRPFRDFQFALKNKDGVSRFLSVSGKSFFDEEGNFQGYRGTATDITERKKTEERIKKSEAQLTEIFAIAPEAVITIGADMTIQLFNKGAERIFGYETVEVLGQSLDKLMPEHFRENHRRHIEAFVGSGDTYLLMAKRREIMGLRKDGTEFPASASVSKLEIDGKTIFTVMLQDITERKLAQDAMMVAQSEAETANRAKSEFLAAMSHDLRTPLNAILGFADILSHQYFGPINDKYREYAGDIHSSGEHLLTLVNDILDLSTIEAGKQSLIKEKLSAMEIVGECERIIEERARSLGIDLITKVPKSLPPLYADRRAIKQILLNLLSNAVKFTPAGGKITVSAKATKQNFALKVADTGRGIPAEKLQNLTDPFIRVDGDPYLAERGWGLGLSIIKSLIDLHNGKLDIKSKVGKGTTVTVTFPNGVS